ncbi:MAG: glycerol-3-phosphate responsive antiterminator [Ruminococcaceae bacterium]|nr:glycerol-3-phosphate responsive antiterminator [Oscillospiraceae bacterium]
MNISEIYEENPIIAAVKDDIGFNSALDSSCRTIFFLYGNICDIPRKVELVKNAGKLAIVHTDLIEGLENRDIAVRFIKEATLADGVISTRTAIVKAAREYGLIAIQRFFLIDSIALDNARRHIEQGIPDLIEVLPALAPKIISKLRSEYSIPIIAGGLISDKDDVITALSAGASAISTTKRDIWYL